jgi:hypothetical protein
MDNKYPITKLPSRLKDILNKEGALLKPKKITPPDKPEEPSYKQIDSYPYGAIGIFIGVLFLLISDGDENFMFAGVVVLIIASIRMLINHLSKNHKQNYNYREKEEYREHLKSYQDDYNSYLKNHERNQYLFKLYENLDYTSLRKEYAIDYLKFSEDFHDLDYVDNTKGIIEDQIYNYFKQHFPSKIHRTMSVFFDYYTGENDAYFPDMIYFDPRSNLKIDIEIDEPYVATTGEPIHLGYRDSKRDDFFLKNRWVVIRFSEKQAALYPKSCCKELAKLVDKIIPGEEDLKQFESTKDLPLDRSWSYEEAKQMALSRYRETYLNNTQSEFLKHFEYKFEEPGELDDDLPF